MHIMHIALGGCLRAPPVQYGLSEDTGGHITYILGAAMHQSRHPGVTRVDVVTRSFDTFGPDYARSTEPLAPNAQILRLRTGNPDYLTKTALWNEIPALTSVLTDLLRDGPRPDILHAHFADAAEVAFAAAEVFGIPVVYTPHSLALDKDHGGREMRRLDAEHRAIGQAKAIIVSSRDEAERQIPAYDPAAIARTHRISPGVSADMAAGDPSVAQALLDGLLDDPGKPMILAIARPVAKKNLSALVRAFVDDPVLRDAANLVILAGQHATAEPEARAIIATLEAVGSAAAGSFVLPPAHDSRHVAALYALAAKTRGVFVNPALFEPFGLTLLEAAQAGLPVVATRHGGPSIILDDIRHGCAVDPRDTAAMAKAILSLIGNAAQWDQASVNARAGIAGYDWNRYAAESIDVYHSLKRSLPSPHPAPTRLLACDIDNTLTGCMQSAQQFSQWAEQAAYPFVVATGRSLPEARTILRAWKLPEPVAYITSVGTEIFLPTPNGLALWDAYGTRISASWDRAEVQAIITALQPDWQPDVDQKAHKISLFGTENMARRIRAALLHHCQPAQVIHSHGRLIDVLPPAAGKANAIAALAGRYGLKLKDCIAAGDSGNDFDMLSRCGTAIVVANAGSELATLPQRAGLVRATLPYAGGVLEALGMIEGVA